MNRAVRDQWITALRSGEYEQTCGTLYDTKDGKPYHCALGVLVEEGLKSGVHLVPSFEPHDSYHGRYGDTPVDRLIPELIAEWADIDWDSEEIAVMNLNDAGWPFEEIAEYIEENL